jgi:hypothetical protein
MASISSSDKPRLSFWQIWNMSFGFLGIQFGFALQNANTHNPDLPEGEHWFVRRRK